MNTLTIANIAIRQQTAGLYRLQDLHKAAVKDGANARTKEPGKFLASPRTQEMIAVLKRETTTQNLGSCFEPIITVEGREGGTYVCLELVVAYGQFVSTAFDLKVIRSFLGGVAKPLIQNRKFWDASRPHWAAIADMALAGWRNKRIAAQLNRSASSVGACLRRMYEVGYCNPVEVFKARLQPATAARWAIAKPIAAQWGLLLQDRKAHV